jgi:hypothetical protein
LRVRASFVARRAFPASEGDAVLKTGPPLAAVCAAAIYSLLGSAKLNGLYPELYLHQVLERIADYPISRITELLPWNLEVMRMIRRGHCLMCKPHVKTRCVL